MDDRHVGDAVVDERQVLDGYAYAIEYLGSVVFCGFGVRFNGVTVRADEPTRVDTMFVPVETISSTFVSPSARRAA